MLVLLISGVLLSIATQGACRYSLGYEFYPDAGGWLKLQKTPATWQQALGECLNEDAVLASPLNDELRSAIQTITKDKNHVAPFYIGANAIFTAGQFVSIEEIPIAKMPVREMFDVLDDRKGECLSMNSNSINVVSCSQSLAYLCYKKTTECGTSDPEYRYEPSTGSCYKVHRALRTRREASSLCLSEGGHLPIINNEVEARLVKDMIPDVPMDWAVDQWLDWRGVFIGVVDWVGDGKFRTIHAKPLDAYFNKWDDNQPDGLTKVTCAVINRRGKLDNIWCTNKAPVICEKDPQNVINSQEQPDEVGATLQ